MKHPIRVCIGVAAVLILSAILVIERGTGWAAPKPPVPEFKMKTRPTEAQGTESDRQMP